MDKYLKDSSWKLYLDTMMKSRDFLKIMDFLEAEYKSGKTIYPPKEEIFYAFNMTPFSKVKVVILGQDPYHGEKQAHGLSFSVKTQKIPPSLKNIYKELKNDLELKIPNSGDLSSWAENGVLLLNSALTVRADQAGSHQKVGWEIFTDQVISLLNEHKTNLVFILWGAFAGNKEYLIDQSKHLVLKAPHPSPLSSYRGFFGCKHFSKTNQYLKKNNIKPIDWTINP